MSCERLWALIKRPQTSANQYHPDELDLIQQLLRQAWAVVTRQTVIQGFC